MLGSTMVYDYGFRIYNPTIGKFLSVDPLTKSYPWYTPYQYAGNKPIRFIDLDGLEEEDPMNGYIYGTPFDNAEEEAEFRREQQEVANHPFNVYVRPVLQFLSPYLPITGDVQDLFAIGSSIKKGEYEEAAFTTIFLLPGGDAAKASSIPAKALNETLESGAAYKVGRYLFKTDDIGRVSNVSGKLELDEIGRNIYQQQKSVRIKDGVKGQDDGGHLIAQMFGGPKEQINYLPMLKESNRWADWRTLERKWGDALVEGKTVDVNISPIFEGSSKRPSRFEVEYKIDGESFDEIISN